MRNSPSIASQFFTTSTTAFFFGEPGPDWLPTDAFTFSTTSPIFMGCCAGSGLAGAGDGVGAGCGFAGDGAGVGLGAGAGDGEGSWAQSVAAAAKMAARERRIEFMGGRM